MDDKKDLKKPFGLPPDFEKINTPISIPQLPPNPTYKTNELLEEQSRILAEQGKILASHSKKLDELRKPHWTMTPIFWVGAITLFFTVIGVIFAIWSYFNPPLSS
jgi:hypothetical protein